MGVSNNQGPERGPQIVILLQGHPQKKTICFRNSHSHMGAILATLSLGEASVLWRPKHAYWSVAICPRFQAQGIGIQRVSTSAGPHPQALTLKIPNLDTDPMVPNDPIEFLSALDWGPCVFLGELILSS